MWGAFWNFIAKVFRIIFSVLDWASPWFNKLIIVVGFIAFILWLRQMSRDNHVEKFD